jgi:exonuclease SbcC
MYLELKNFRCFKNLKIDLPDSGVVLLNGHSGVGKTSIFKAINFVLYDDENKCVMSGEKTCQVTMKYKNYTIVRSKSPTFLHFITSSQSEPERKLVGDSAQAKIYEVFGQHFKLTNYLTQKAIKTFFNLSRDERREFLQHLVIQNFDIESKRELIKKKIKERKSIASIRAGMLESTKQEAVEYHQQPTFPIKITNGVTPEACLKEEAAQRNKNKTKMHALQEQISNIEIQIQNSEETQKRITVLSAQLDHYLDEQKRVQTLIDKFVVQSSETLEQEISDLEEQVYFADMWVKLKDFEQEHAAILKNLQSKKQEQLDELTNKLKHVEFTQPAEIMKLKKINLSVIEFERVCNQIYKQLKKTVQKENVSSAIESAIRGLDSTISECDPTSLQDEKFELEMKISQIKQEIKDCKDSLSGKDLICPECSTQVSLRNGHLHKKNTQDIKNHIETLTSKLEEEQDNLDDFLEYYSECEVAVKNASDIKNTLEGLHSSFKELKDECINVDIQELQSKIDSCVSKNTEHLSLQQRLKELNSKDIYQDSVLKSKTVQIDKMKKLLLQDNCDINTYVYPENLDHVKRELDSKNQMLGAISSQNDRLREHKRELQRLTNKISEIKQELLSCEKDSVDTTSVDELKTDFIKRMQKDKIFEERRLKIEKYERELALYTKWQQWDMSVTRLQEECDRAEVALSIANQGLTILNETESNVLETLITNINTDIEEYMNLFFDDGLKMKIVTFVRSAQGEKKSQLEVQFEREGEEINTDTLSGGEYDRCVLGLFLAFNKNSSKEFILLDECISSLHSELVEDIVETIKKESSNKLVLFTLHQANIGLFDHVIEIEN